MEHLFTSPAQIVALPPDPLTQVDLAAKLYYYQAVVKSVYDGDTITVDIDLGMGVWVHGEKVRLLRINAPELKGDTKTEGIKSRDQLRSLVDGKQIVIRTHKDDKEKYGRYLAEVWLLDPSGNYTNINDQLVQGGFAAHKDY